MPCGVRHGDTAATTKLPLAAAARMCGMSTSKSTRSFKQVPGMPYLAFLTHLRLAEAARLLRLGDRCDREWRTHRPMWRRVVLLYRGSVIRRRCSR